MAKLNYDKSSAENLVNSNLDNSINDLKSISSVFNQTIIPYDFAYKTYLTQTSEVIKSYISEISNLNQKMRNSYKTLSNINEEIKKELSGIENYSISLRQSAIK